MNPSANNIGVLKRIDQPQRERNNVVMMAADRALGNDQPHKINVRTDVLPRLRQEAFFSLS